MPNFDNETGRPLNSGVNASEWTQLHASNRETIRQTLSEWELTGDGITESRVDQIHRYVLATLGILRTPHPPLDADAQWQPESPEAQQARMERHARLQRQRRFRRQRVALHSAFQLLDDAHNTYSLRTARTHMRRAVESVGAAFDYSVTPNELMRRYARLRDFETFSCDSCGDDFPESLRLHSDDAGEDRCPHCVSYDVSYTDRTFSSYDPEPGDWYDEESGFSEDNESLMGHSANPIYELNRNYLCDAAEESRMTDKTRLFGFEIEYVCDDSEQLRRIVRNRNGVGIHKQDGSLPYAGGEFCTLPMTRAFAAQALEKGKGEFKSTLDSMVEKGARAWNRTCCGLHIHVTRASASWITWGKVERFMNSAANQTLIDRVAGRLQNSYCQRERIPDAKTIPIRRARDKAQRGSDRYQALNFATNKPTVEFRLFRGNVAYAGVIRCMEFCDSLIEWARTQSSGANMDSESYLAWLKTHASAYATLAKYLKLFEKGEANAWDSVAADSTLAA